MHTKNLRGRFAQLSHASPSAWVPFILGWMRRHERAVVPCIMPAGGKLFYVPLRDFYESYQFFSESPEGQREMAFFLRQLTPGDVLYDIGGFRGAYSMAAKAKLGDRISIHVFEPVPQSLDVVRTICELNDYKGVSFVPKAVSDGSSVSGTLSDGDVMLRLGDSSASPIKADFPAITLDEYIEKSGSNPSVMKIDVEGFELNVLQGARRLLAACKPRLWIEIHPDFLSAQNKSHEEVFQFLKRANYQVTLFSDYDAPSRNISFHAWCV